MFPQSRCVSACVQRLWGGSGPRQRTRVTDVRSSGRSCCTGQRRPSRIRGGDAMHIWQFVAITALIGALLVIPRATAAPEREAILEGRAVLPAQTFAPGPVSGTLLSSTPINGVTVPFASQPIQGISAVLDAGDSSFWIMEDNGYARRTTPPTSCCTCIASDLT